MRQTRAILHQPISPVKHVLWSAIHALKSREPRPKKNQLVACENRVCGWEKTSDFDNENLLTHSHLRPQFVLIWALVLPRNRLAILFVYKQNIYLIAHCCDVDSLIRGIILEFIACTISFRTVNHFQVANIRQRGKEIFNWISSEKCQSTRQQLFSFFTIDFWKSAKFHQWTYTFYHYLRFTAIDLCTIYNRLNLLSFNKKRQNKT